MSCGWPTEMGTANVRQWLMVRCLRWQQADHQQQEGWARSLCGTTDVNMSSNKSAVVPMPPVHPWWSVSVQLADPPVGCLVCLLSMQCLLGVQLGIWHTAS